MITEDIRPAMQGAFPATVVTCALDGTPNTTFVSQVFYIDEEHVALSFQFFNKTVRNVRENPHACITVIHPYNLEHWTFEIEFIRSETEGDVFDEMDMQLEAIASMTGMSDVFKLHAADIYKVKAVHKNDSYSLN